MPVVYAPAIRDSGLGGVLLGCQYVVGEGTFISERVIGLLRCTETARALYDSIGCALEMGCGASAAWAFDFDDCTYAMLTSQRETVRGDSIGLASFASLIAAVDGSAFRRVKLAASAAIRITKGRWCCEAVADIRRKASLARDSSIDVFYVSAAQRREMSGFDSGSTNVVFLPADMKAATRVLLASLREHASPN